MSGSHLGISTSKSLEVLSLLPTETVLLLRLIPQPAGWGYFTPAYRNGLTAPPNPPTGRLGILHSSL